jgi:hypothetical protein
MVISINFMKENKEKLISLKEAAEISGYAPDYIGQLIRKGKIPGKQVYHNVAWMTTEEAIREYVKGNSLNESGTELKGSIRERARKLRFAYFSENQTMKLAQFAMYFILAILVASLIFLLYVFAANLEKKVNQDSVRRVQQTHAYENQ